MDYLLHANHFAVRTSELKVSNFNATKSLALSSGAADQLSYSYSLRRLTPFFSGVQTLVTAKIKRVSFAARKDGAPSAMKVQRI